MAKKGKGVGVRKGNILIDEIDLKVLKLLNEIKEELSIGDVQNKVRMSHVSFKGHVRRLEKLNFITRNQVPKTFRFILKITNDGKEVLRIFEKAIK